MANVLSDQKRQQVEALGRLGWTLRRIERETGVRRETASEYLRAAGIAVRGRPVPEQDREEPCGRVAPCGSRWSRLSSSLRAVESPTMSVAPLQFLLLVFAGWVNRRQVEVIEYLQEENRVLREQFGAGRLRSPMFSGGGSRRRAQRSADVR